MSGNTTKKTTDEDGGFLFLYKTGDVLLRRDENDLKRLYVVDDIERVVDGRIDNGRLVTLYNPETDGYFIENTRSESTTPP